MTRAAKIGAQVRFYDAGPGFGVEMLFAPQVQGEEGGQPWAQTAWSQTQSPS